jgi:hypothetical protein
MIGRWRWFALAALAALVATLALATASAPDSPSHEVTSDARGGTSALRELATLRGHPTTIVEGNFDLPPGGELFVFSPSVPVSQTESDRIREWVRAGGHLVFAAEVASPPLDATLGLKRTGASGTTSRGDGLLLPDVYKLTGRFDSAFVTAPEQRALLTDAAGHAVAVRYGLGAGSVIALSAAESLANGFLEKTDNAVFAAALLDMGANGATVRFDEYHHGAQVGGSAVNALYSFAWGRALAWSVIVVFAGLALLGRVVGATEHSGNITTPAMDEHTQAVGRLLRLAGGRSLAADSLAAATRRSVAGRTGLGADPGRPDFQSLLRRFDPGLAGRLEQAQVAALSVRSDADLAAAARQLHALAYPMPPRP